MTVVAIVAALWIVIRQMSLVGSRFRAAGESLGEWSVKNILARLYLGSVIPIVTIRALL